MALEKGGGNPDFAMYRAGWAARLQNSFGYILLLGQQKDLLGADNEGAGDVLTILGDDPGGTIQGGKTVAAHQVRCGPRGGKSAQLFWTTGDIHFIIQIGEAVRIGADGAGIAGAESHQAGAD